MRDVRVTGHFSPEVTAMFSFCRPRCAAPRLGQRVFRFEALESRSLLSVSPGYVEERFSTIRDLTEVNDELYFVAYGENERFGLWRTDGTDSGTAQVKELGGRDQFWTDYQLTNVNGRLFFVADDGVHGRELWTSDGTEAGTHMVRDITPGPEGWAPSRLMNVDGTLFFLADDGQHGRELWKSDATEEGTVLVADLIPGPGSILPAFFDASTRGGELFFVAGHGEPGAGLYGSDGTSEGTTQLRSGDFFEVVVVGDDVFFRDTEMLWKSDGTVAGTVLVKDFERPGVHLDSAYLRELTNVGGKLFFTAEHPTHGSALWTSDGTPEGTVVVIENPGTSGFAPHWHNFTDVDGELYVIGVLENFDGAHGLWRTDGTPEGTVYVRDVGKLTEVGDRLDIVATGDTVYFGANVGPYGYELWKTDGTLDGASIVRDVVPGISGSLTRNRSEIVAAGDYVYFTLFDTPFGAELWRTDGTSAGTVRVLPHVEFAGEPEGFFEQDGREYFITVDADGNEQMWQGDGTPQGSYPVAGPARSIPPGGWVGTRTPLVRVLSSPKWWGHDSIGFWEPTNNAFFLKHGFEPGDADVVVELGFEALGWKPLVADWDATLGDGFGLYRDGYFLIKYDQSDGPEDLVVQYGAEGNDWLPLAGDWDGDGHATIGLYDPQTSTFFLRNELAPGEADLVFQFGAPDNGWEPLVGDWNGDGVDTVGFYTGQFFLLTDSLAPGEAEIVYDYGPAEAGWYPLVGDWNGDGIDTMALYSGDLFFMKNAHTSGEADFTVAFGSQQNTWILQRSALPWIPIAGNWFPSDVIVASLPLVFGPAAIEQQRDNQSDPLILVLDEMDEGGDLWAGCAGGPAPWAVDLGGPISAGEAASSETTSEALDADLVDAVLA